MRSKHNLTLLVCLLCCSIILSAQEEAITDNSDRITFIKHIKDNGQSRGVTVEEVKGGGYILTGYTTAGDQSGENVFLTKLNAHGEKIWSKIFGGNNTDHGWAVRQTNDEGFILVGYTDSFGNNGMDVYLIRTDSNGEIMWIKTFGGEKEEYGWDVRITKDQGFIIAAQTNSSGEGEIDAYLIKVNADGDEQWSKTYGGLQIDRIFSVQETQDGGFVAAGITYSFSSVNPEDRDGYLLKTDSSGHLEWFKTFGLDEYDVAHSIATTDDGGYIITGYGESYSKNEGRDVYLIKTDSKGNQLWLQTYGGQEDERGIKGQQTKDGGYIAIGFTDKNWDIYLVKADRNGAVMWTRTYGEPDKIEFGYTVKETKDGGYVLIGHSESLDRSERNVILIKTDSEGIVNQRK